MWSKGKGFSVAELIIAVFMIGVVAAFTIPKILHPQDTQVTRTKLRQTASGLEQAFYNLKYTGDLQYELSLYENLLNELNVISKGLDDTNPIAIDPGSPLGSIGTDHPCNTVHLEDPNAEVLNSFIELPSGAVVTGLYRTDPDAQMDNYAWNNSSKHNATDNYIICIDVNGAQGPNTMWSDVFIANFNMWAAYDGTPKSSGKAFNWGGPSGPIYDTSGNILGGPGNIGDPAMQGSPHVGFYLID
jgi:type II secretory pathway pseudopilin PulG